METTLTHGPGGRLLTNVNVWSPDGEWIVYDTRSDAAGNSFDSTRIERVHARSGEIRTVYQSRNGACCGVATWHPTHMFVAFILGPEHPTASWSYGPSRRQGVIVDTESGVAINLDARNLTPPFTPGALSGGSHVHVFHPHGDWVSFTYDDELNPGSPRNVAIAVPGEVKVNRGHPRNHDGAYTSVLATETVARPEPGSDEIGRACEEAWIGNNRSLAFQGIVVTTAGMPIAEVFVSDFADKTSDLAKPRPGLQNRFDGMVQRRLTHTEHRRHPGLQGPRHWLRSSPDGTRIGCLMRDDRGVVQFFTVYPGGGEPVQVTHCEVGISSAFTWSPCGSFVAAVVDEGVSKIDVNTGRVVPLSAASTARSGIRPEACVFSPDGRSIGYVRREVGHNQIMVCSVE